MEPSNLERKRTNALLAVLAVVAVGFLLVALRGVILPLFVAFFLSYLGMPVMRLGQRLRIPVPVRVVLVIALFAVAIGGVGIVFYVSGEQFVARLPRYRERLVEIGNQLLKLPQLEAYVERVERGEERRTQGGAEGGAPAEGGATTTDTSKPPEGSDPPVVEGDPAQDPVPIGQPPGRAPDRSSISTERGSRKDPEMEREISWTKIMRSGGLVDVAGSLLGGFANALLILVFLVFILMDRGREALDRRIILAFSAPGSESARPILEEIHREIEKYIVTKTALSFLTGAFVSAALAVLDLPFALLFGAMAFLMNFIPNVGSIVASVPPLLIAAVHFGTVGDVLEVGVVLLVIHSLIGFLDPVITGKSLHLNPITVLLWLVVWGWLWGLWGMALAVPLAATTRIIAERTLALRPLGVLMGD